MFDPRDKNWGLLTLKNFECTIEVLKDILRLVFEVLVQSGPSSVSKDYAHHITTCPSPPSWIFRPSYGPANGAEL